MRRARRPCPTPGCPNLTQDPKGCPACRTRTGGHRATYDAAWDTLAREVLRAHKTCQRCHSARAVEAHHIRAITTHPQLRLARSNVLALCHDCHRDLTPTGH